MTRRSCTRWRTPAATRAPVTGGHHDRSSRWKGNRGKSGSLPEEQSELDRWIDGHGFVDVHRRLHGPGPGPYTWRSWRGRAFDADAGWRIDDQLASAPLAPRAVRAEVGRAASHGERWSDHAPVSVLSTCDPTRNLC